MKTLLIITGLMIIFIDCCAQQKVLMKGTTVYVYSQDNGSIPKSRYTKYKVIKAKKVEFVDNGSYIIIKEDPSQATEIFKVVSTKQNIELNKKVPEWKHTSKGTAYFSEGEDEDISKFWYRDGKVILQAISVPIKIRQKVKARDIYAAVPSTTETGVNVGFLGGYKFSWNKYRKSTNLFGQQTARYSVTPGVFVGMGAADLSTTATRPSITTARKAAMITSGGSVVLGFNSINIGYAFGWDHAMGSSSKTWVFRGKLWHGVIVSLDLIK